MNPLQRLIKQIDDREEFLSRLSTRANTLPLKPMSSEVVDTNPYRL